MQLRSPEVTWVNFHLTQTLTFSTWYMSSSSCTSSEFQLPLSLIHPVSFVNDHFTFYTQRTLEDTDKHIFSQLWLSMSVSKCKWVWLSVAVYEWWWLARAEFLHRWFGKSVTAEFQDSFFLQSVRLFRWHSLTLHYLTATATCTLNV